MNNSKENTLAHFGILGMKWGVRRYKNKDGTLTSAGKRKAASNTRYQKELSEFNNQRLSKNQKKASEYRTKYEKYQAKVDKFLDAQNKLMSMNVNDIMNVTKRDMLDTYNRATVDDYEKSIYKRK